MATTQMSQNSKSAKVRSRLGSAYNYLKSKVYGKFQTRKVVKYNDTSDKIARDQKWLFYKNTIGSGPLVN